MIRVVIADDEQKVSQLILNLVDWASLDMQVVGVAGNGIEAVELVERERPDILITDIRMPGYDGLELIRRAKEIQHKLEIIIVSGYRYFDYAQTAIKFGVSDYILKPINQAQLTATLGALRDKYMSRTRRLSEQEELSHQIKGAIDRMRLSLFEAVAQDDSPVLQNQSLEDINKKYNYNMRPGCFQICALKIDDDQIALTDDSLEVLQEKCRAVIKENLSDDCYDMEVKNEDSFLYILLNYGEDNREFIRRRLLAALNDLRKLTCMFSNVEFTIAAGEAKPEPSALWYSYQTAYFTIMQRLILGGDAVLDGLTPVNQPSHGASIAQVTVKELEAGIELLDEKRIGDALAAFSQKLMETRPMTGDALILNCHRLFDDYLALMRKFNLNAPHADERLYDFRKRIHLCSTAEKVLEFTRRDIEKTFREALAHKKLQDSLPIRTAKQFIHENYMKPITLEEVSESAGFNASYFSHVFKKETGKNYLEYVSELRVNRAKELLRETRASIADICERVGYVDIRYFTKIFKKFTGVSPREFRKLYS